MSAVSQAEALTAGLNQLTGRDPDAGHIKRLLAYVSLLQRWNRTYNLTAVRDPTEIVTRHLLDSLSILPWIESGPLLDAGTGAGLPGIPLAIMRPDVQVTLLDSTGKKIRFLNHVQRELNMDNVTMVQARLESFQTELAYREIISRAFADLRTFGRAARHLADGQLRLLAMKGKYPDKELSALPKWLLIDSIEKLYVPGLQEDRHLVIMSVIA